MSRAKHRGFEISRLKTQLDAANLRIRLLDTLLTECQNKLDTANLTIDQIRIANEWYPYDNPRDE